MSFYDHFIEDGASCSQCHAFIGKPVGYTRQCLRCSDSKPRKVKAAHKSKRSTRSSL